ncbi:MAG: TonB-dependent receptor [Chitinophagaceae bacterium]|nr:TonB-dependent receptor [Chitinophagaceae bacterium]
MPSKLTVVRLWLTAIALMFATVTFAQQKTITGKVTSDKDKTPIFGATVTVKGSTTGTQTNADGNFSIQVPNSNAVLVVTFVGFETQEVSVANKAVMEIALKEKSTTLTDVVVTGYSSQAKKDITGSVSVVKVADMVAVPSGSAEQQLQGRASGVTVTSSGQPGDGASVRIRGFGSFYNNNPLYVIDGVQTDNLGDINPNDIESIQVLKDASAASIYGSKASNGVIIVTTKKGRTNGGVKVSYDAYYGVQGRGKGFDMLNPQEMANLTWLALRNSGQVEANGNPKHPQYGNGATPVLPDYILAGSLTGVMNGNPAADPSKYFLNLDDPNSSYLIHKANKAGTNWYNEVFSTQPLTNHNLSVTGGGQNSRIYFGLNYFDQKGTVMTTYYKRYTARFNSEFTVKNKVRIGQNFQMSYSNNIKIGNQSEGNEISLSYRIQPIVPVYDIAGNFAGQKGAGLGNALNPVAYRVRAKDNRNNDYKFLGNVYAEADIAKHFTVRTSFGGEQYLNNYWYYNFKTYENAENNSTNDYNEGSQMYRSWIWTNQVSYKQTFGEHSINALAGTEAIEDWGRSIYAKRLGYFVDDPNYRALNTGSGVQTNSGSPYAQRARFSVFAKGDYNYADKYLFGATVRRDGSSVFGQDNRYGVFPSFSAGWRISRENFMKSVKFISELKLRGGWGQMGNQNIDPNNAFSTFGGGLGSSFYDLGGTSNSALQGFQQFRIGNPKGKWETNESSNIGFDAVFNGGWEVVLDVYQKKTLDLLYTLSPVATTQGTAGAPFVNIGSMKNSGIDIAVTKRGALMNKKLKYDVTLTATKYKNEIIAIAEGESFFSSGGSRIGDFARNQVGHPVSAFYGYKVIGIFQDAADVAKSPTQTDAKAGRYKYQDTNGDGKIDDNDRTYYGNPNPKLTYGLNLNLQYEGFDLSAFFYGVQGKDVINYTRWWTDYYASFQGGKSKAALYNAWSPTNKGGTLPIVENSSNFSNQAVPNSSLMEDGSYLRLKSLILGYTLPKSTIGKLGIDKFRIYAQAANLFTITKYSGLDPEFVGSDTAFGIDYGNYPNQKQFLFGVNVTF